MVDFSSARASFTRNRRYSGISVPELPAETADYEFYQVDTPLSLGVSEKGNDGADRRYSQAVPVVVCRVCQNKIPLVGYDLDDHFIAKCGVCKEATPIRAAPPGERYIRCVCNCLLVCRKSAAKIACPRLNCQRIISIAAGDASNEDEPRASQPPPGTCRLVCPYCKQPFIFSVLDKSLTKCPYCDKVSAIDDEHRTQESRRSFILALAFVVTAVIIITVNCSLSERFTGEITLYIFISLIALISCVRAFLFWRIKVSRIQGFL